MSSPIPPRPARRRPASEMVHKGALIAQTRGPSGLTSAVTGTVPPPRPPRRSLRLDIGESDNDAEEENIVEKEEAKIDIRGAGAALEISAGERKAETIIRVLDRIDVSNIEEVRATLTQVKEAFEVQQEALASVRTHLRDALLGLEEKDLHLAALINQLNAQQKPKVAFSSSAASPPGSPPRPRRPPRDRHSSPLSLSAPVGARDPSPSADTSKLLSPRTRALTKSFNKDLLCYVHCPGKEPSMSRYYLAKETSLAEHLQAVCSKFRLVEDPSLFALQMTSTKHYLTAEEFAAPDFSLPEVEPILSLQRAPATVVAEYMAVLRSSESTLAQKKMSLFQLRRSLVSGNDKELGTELIRQCGHEVLLDLLQSKCPASVTSVVLGCLAIILSDPVYPWGETSASYEEILNLIATMVAAPNTNVQQNALLVFRTMSLQNDVDAAYLHETMSAALSAALSDPYEQLVSLISNPDINIQANAMGVIHGLVRTSEAVSSEVQKDVLQRLEAVNFTDRLKEQTGVRNETFQKHFHAYEIERLGSYLSDSRQAFDPIVPSQKALLVELWRAGKTSSEAVPSLNSNQWLAFGFKETDVAKQLSPSILLIKHILQYVQVDPARFLKFVSSYPGDKFFPVASASIYVTHTLNDFLGVNEVDMDRGRCKAYSMMLGCGNNAVAEVHNHVMDLMLHAWKALKNPSTDDITALSSMMHVVVKEALDTNPETIAAFGKLLLRIADKTLNDSSKDKKKKSDAKPVSKKRVKFRVFEQSLNEIIANERLENPSASVPQILIVLIDAIKRMDGYAAEGIFRVSVKMAELERMKTKMDQGHYDIDFLTAYHPAALLKLWLRELSSPLIPVNLYQEALDAAEDAEGTANLLAKLPEVNKSVVKMIGTFLQDLGSPMNEEKTKMGFSNLALVFAPGFLCSEDPSARLFNSERERMFVESVIEAL